ncbi:hypothetical protein NCS52_00731400 [Fusarium sp. LHS14.1]|nr:hypothetical protein NCS52_00731400 [Fusarium sp. LHS14.1]
MEPRPERDRQRDGRQAPIPQDPLNHKLAAVGGYFKRLTTATIEWVSEPDEWKKRFTNNNKISPEIENKSIGDTLRASGVDYDEIDWLMRPTISSARCERRVLRVKRFCAGADFRLNDAVPAELGNPASVGAQEPEAWVSDRNWVDETFVGDPPNYPLILDNNELYEVLEKKRFPPGSQGDIVGPPRRIYIKNPNGSSVVAMTKRTPASHVDGFRNLFADYITPTPEPKFRLRESTWWRGCFVISFNIPYYGITTQDLQDSRAISHGRERLLRNRYELDFLHLDGYEVSEGESPFYHGGAILHQLVFSLTVTGKSDKYWTAACLDDDFFGEDLGEEPRLASDVDWEGKTDPILLKAENDLTLLPRAYAIAALEVALSKIVEIHANVLEWFRASLARHTSDAENDSLPKISPKELQDWIEKFPEAVNKVAHSTSSVVRKLDLFLKEDVMMGPNAQPQGVLWQSLQSDSDALRSLQIIKQYRDDLCDIKGELEQLEIACEGVRRKRKNDNEGEQQTLTKQVHKIAIAAFVFAILNMVAQLYAAIPDMGHSASWPSYAAIITVCVLLSAAVAMYLSGQSWQQVWQWLVHVFAFLPRTWRAWRHPA